MIHFTCHGCGHRIKAPDESAGRKGKCPKCGNPVVVPAAEGRPAKDDSAVDPGVRNHPGAGWHTDANHILGGDPRIRQCPHCGGVALTDATTCVHCHRSLDKSHGADSATGGAAPKLNAARAGEKTERKSHVWSVVFLVAVVWVAASALAALLLRAPRTGLEPRGYFYANRLGGGIGVGDFSTDRIVPEHVVFCIVVVDVASRRFGIGQGYEFDPRRFTLILPDGNGSAGAVITLWNTEKDKHMYQTWGPRLGLYQNGDVNTSDAFISSGEFQNGRDFEPFAKNVVRPMMSLAIGFVLPDGEHKPPLAIRLDKGSQIPVPGEMIKVSESIAAYDPDLPRDGSGWTYSDGIMDSRHRPIQTLHGWYAVQSFEDDNRRFFTCRYPCGWTVHESDDVEYHRVEFVGAEAKISVRIALAQGEEMADAKAGEMLQRKSEELFPAKVGTLSDGAVHGSAYQFMYEQTQPPSYSAVLMVYSYRRFHVLMLQTASDYLLKKWLSEFERFLSSYEPRSDLTEPSDNRHK